MTALVGLHMTDLKGDMSEGKLRVFIATHAGLMEELAALMRADAYATRGVPVGEPRIEKLYRSMLEDGTPFSVADLPVNGVDAERAGLKGRRIGDALDALWKDAVLNPVLRERGHALAYLEKRAAKERDDERK